MSQQIEIIRNPNGERNELYCQYIQIDAMNPKQNDLISTDGEYPSTVELQTTISPPITDIHDIAVASLFYSNEHHRIAAQNNRVRLSVELPTGDAYSVELAVDHGTYTAESLELTLNALIEVLPSKPWRSNNAMAPPFDASFEPLTFQLVNHATPTTVGRTVVRLKFPVGAKLSVSGSLAALLGFAGQQRAVVSQKSTQVSELVSPKMHNLTYDQSTFHLASNALGQILEYPPSANAAMRENIVLSHHTVVEAMTPILVDEKDVRFRAKTNARLSKIDLQLLDQNFRPIENSQMSAFSVVLLVRRTKQLVV